MRVALVHDWLNQVGGAENVLEHLVSLYPEAPIYTSIYWPEAMPARYREWEIRTTWMDKLPMVHRHHQPFLPLYPVAFEGLDLSGYDVVLSNKSGFCHGVITPPETLHVCYCLSPTRYVWRYHDYARREGLGRLARAALAPVLSALRVWDRGAADRVDRYIAISTEIQRRIHKYYRRESDVIYPPVDTARFAPADEYDDYYLVVGRQVPYKRIDLAVQACTELGLPLKVAGSGRDQARLRKMAGPTVEFLGYVPDRELPALLAGCKAFLFPGAEDFGIAPLEAMAAGRPVIAYAYGGALDTVVEGVTGILFPEQTARSLAEAIRRFDARAYDPWAIRRHAERFDAAVFRERIAAYVAQAWEEHRAWN
ncbi:MAG: glycosyltransferase [Anaerolineae bacterium]|nr:glycosyltransferase [Anaerolineae bacterium]